MATISGTHLRDLAKMYESGEQYTEAVAQLKEILVLADDCDPEHDLIISTVRDSLVEISKRIRRDDEVAMPREEEIEQLPAEIKGYGYGQEITGCMGCMRGAKSTPRRLCCWRRSCS
jgi:hypothetical protein